MPGSCRNIHDPGKHKIGRLEMSKKKENKNALHGFLLVMPWFVGFLIFYLYPICSNIGLSFTDKTIWGEGKFVGLKNYYKIFFEAKVFWICLKNTFLWVIFSDGIEGIAGFWDNGIRYFKIASPTGEQFEFCQIL